MKLNILNYSFHKEIYFKFYDLLVQNPAANQLIKLSSKIPVISLMHN